MARISEKEKARRAGIRRDAEFLEGLAKAAIKRWGVKDVVHYLFEVLTYDNKELLDSLRDEFDYTDFDLVDRSTYKDPMEEVRDLGYAVIKLDNYEDEYLLKQFVRSTIVTHSLSFENNCLFPS